MNAPPTPHAEAIERLLAMLASGPAGLSDAEAADRLRRHGPNRLAPRRPPSAAVILWNQLRSVVVWLLMAAAGIALALGEPVEAAAIAAVLILNTALGFTTEWRARRAMAALLDLDVPRAHVVRAGALQAVDAHLLVPGDVIEIAAGQAVPADGRLIGASDLRVDESALTGESLPIAKTLDPLPVETQLADRTNMVHKSTIAVSGTARALVTGTGAATEVGRIGTLTMGIDDEPTLLERRLDALGRRLVWLALAVGALVGLMGAAQGVPLGVVVETAIALAVAAVPEALPAVATIALAVGVHRMARRSALVRRLPAVESLGSATVVCTDKTRTLTSGDMTVVRLWVDGEAVDLASTRGPLGTSRVRALEVAALASRVQAQDAGNGGSRSGADPVDTAMLRAAEDAGVDRTRLLAERPPAGVVPFSSERQLMASFHTEDGRLMAFVKGAPGRIFDVAAVHPDRRASLVAVNDALARDGLRVLALAAGPVTAPVEEALRGLTFVGFVGLMDPPASGVRETIARLRAAGLRTIMLTGDQRLTAEAVGRTLGLLSHDAQVLTGRDVDALAHGDLAARVADVAAFSRISPEHKLEIVRALQARGEIVAMLGDGVNDAPALRKADVGVAMGRRGTDIAKDAAAIVLQDDRFETIAAAVEEGRIIFDNIQKFVFYLFSCNTGEVLVLLAAGVFGWPMPLAPLQILWLNMVTDTTPALALALEPGERDVMRRPPRDPREAILSRMFVARIGLYAAMIAASTLAAYAWALRVDPAHAQTVAFMTLGFAQTWHLGNARSEESVLLSARRFANLYALAAVVLTVGLQLAALHTPLAGVLDLVALSRLEWAVVLGCSLVPAIIGQGLALARPRA